MLFVNFPINWYIFIVALFKSIFTAWVLLVTEELSIIGINKVESTVLEGLDWMFFENIRTGKLKFEFGNGTYKPIWTDKGKNVLFKVFVLSLILFSNH